MSASHAPATPETGDPVAERLVQWRAEVTRHGGPNTLLWSDHAIALDITHAHPGGLAKLLAGKSTRLTELYREASAQARAFSRARAIRAKQLELARERGVPGSFLAIGRASWSVARGPRPNAPVFLRRCELVPEDAAQGDFVVVATGELEFNPALRSYLVNAGGADIPFDVLVRMSMRSSGFDPGSAYEALGRAFIGPPGWSIAPDLWLTTFHYAKLSAAADFNRITPTLPAHPIVGRLARGSIGGPQPARVQDAANPEEMTVLDADPSQLAVLEAVRGRRTVVVDSGPGTGKTQTIVNIAADLARQGRSVLVVAGPAGSRAAVAGRLAHLGLSELVSEPGALPSGTARPRRDPVRAAAPQSDWTSAGRELADHVERMHRPRTPWGVTLDQIQERIAELCEDPDPPRSKVRLGGAPLAALGRLELAHWQDTLAGIAADGAWKTSGAEEDPWWGAVIRNQQDRADAEAALAELSPAGLERLDATFDAVFAGVDLPAFPRLVDYGDFVAEMGAIKEVLDVFRIGVFDAPLDEWTASDSGGTLDRWRHGRAVRSYLRPGHHPNDLDAILRKALAVRPLWRLIRASRTLPTQVTGLGQAATAYDKAAGHARYLGARLAGAPDLTRMPLTELSELVDRLGGARDRLEILAEVTGDLDRARAAGLGELVDDLAARSVPADRVARDVEFVWWASLLAELTAADPGYARANGDPVRAAGTRFRDVDRSLQRASAAGLAAQQRGREALIWLCSPLTVGLHLAPERTFDVVVIDEASALTVWESASALARAGQAVIIGDSRLPGPSAFTATTGGEPRRLRADQSLLEAASALWPVYRLEWHYRSHDERLIEAVGASAYAGEMHVIPRPGDSGGLRIESAPADAGGASEVAAAVAAAVTHARLRPKDSLAVVTLDADHAERIRMALMTALDASVDDFFVRDGPEPFVVLDATRLAGVTRDVVIVALGAHALGQVASPTGMRLLTAALTRARSAMHVVHSVDSAGLESAESAISPGPRLLATLLQRRRSTTPPVPTSVLVTDLARRLRARGLRVRVGVAAGLVDLAVSDPFTRGPATLGVAVDGPAYAAITGVRMRDRLVYDQLRRLGWRPLRVLTVDLFRDPAREEARVMAALEKIAGGELHTGPVPTRGVRRAMRPPTGPANEPRDVRRVAGTPSAGPAAGAGKARTNDGQSTSLPPVPESAHDRWLRENRPPHWG